MPNSPFAATLLADFHLLLIWCIGFGWAVRYRHQHRRISWFSGIALLLLIGSVFTIVPMTGGQKIQIGDIIRLATIRMISETAAWILLLGAVFDWQNERLRSPAKQSEYTVKCSNCGRRNSIYSESCAACQAPLFKSEDQPALWTFAKQYFDWEYDLPGSNRRLRGLKRALLGFILIIVSVLLAALLRLPLISTTLIAWIGFTGLPCAVAEVISDRSWNQVTPILRLSLLTLFAFGFGFTILLNFSLAIRP